MGCKYYSLPNRLSAHIPESAADSACLCTFPHNYAGRGPLGNDVLRSLAYLGAAVVLAEFSSEELSFDKRDRYVFLPASLPVWIRESIDAELPVPK